MCACTHTLTFCCSDGSLLHLLRTTVKSLHLCLAFSVFHGEGLWKQLQNYPCCRRRQKLPPEGAHWIRHWFLTKCHLQEERDQVSLQKWTGRRLVKNIPSHFSKARKLKYILNGYSQKCVVLCAWGMQCFFMQVTQNTSAPWNSLLHSS